jgi:hypothetical protein
MVAQAVDSTRVDAAARPVFYVSYFGLGNPSYHKVKSLNPKPCPTPKQDRFARCPLSRIAQQACGARWPVRATLR